jgi:hypothetical protein
MNPSKIISQIRATWLDWDGYLINPNFVRKESTIAWRGSRTMVPIPLRDQDVLLLAAQGEYSFQVLEDEALIQLAYDFDSKGRRLLKASLAYYALSTPDRSEPSEPSEPSELPEQDDEPALMPDDYAPLLDDVPVGEPQGAAWLRIDFSPDFQRKGILHHDCHVHLSGMNLARIPLDGVPSPRQFVEFIFASFYPSAYREHRLKGLPLCTDAVLVASINEHSWPVASQALAQAIMHISVPGCHTPPFAGDDVSSK